MREQYLAHNGIRRQHDGATNGQAAEQQPQYSLRKTRKTVRNWSLAQDEVIAHFSTHDPTKRCRVLIVDDDDLIRSWVASLLKRGGYEVCATSSGALAIQILDAMPCDIVITDWAMPDMDGLDLCREIRSRTETASSYVLMLSVRNGTGDVLAGLSAGADDYIFKGATAEEILARLEVGRRLS